MGDGERHQPLDLTDRVRSLLVPFDAWRLRPGSPWVAAIPARMTVPAQGWKLHLSATPASVEQVLDSVVPDLARDGVAFKFAASVDIVRWLTSRECGRAEFGKVVTVYPANDADAAALAARLHERTAGLAGPRIMSDRPIQPGSVVHYRYGGFGSRRRLDHDGIYRELLVTPDGSELVDPREAWFVPPTWAPNPFDEAAESPTEQEKKAVLLGDRYVVRQAFRHSPKGGVYLASDRDTGTEAVVKHARAHAEADLAGRDARDRLRHEARMLRWLETYVPVPTVLNLFEQDGDLFMAERRLAGEPLRRWVRVHASGAPGVPAAKAVPMAQELTALVRTVHGAGLVLRDLSPTNVLVAPDGTAQLVDLEAAAPAGTFARRTGTPSYRAPELVAGPDDVRTDPAEDLFSLGMLLFLLATGNDPLLPPGERATSDRLRDWLATVAPHSETARLLVPTIVGLTVERPSDRLDLASVQRQLAAAAERFVVPLPVAALLPDADRLVDDGLAHLVATMTPDDGRLWPTGGFGGQTDPGNVQHGAAGILSVLLRAQATPGVSGAARKAANWLAARPDEDPFLPGLYFGRAGSAWVLADAGHALDEPQLAERAGRIAERLPVAWPNPDVAHGLAGAGLTMLHVAHRTGRKDLLKRAGLAADQLLDVAKRSELGITWPIPTTFASQLAGTCHYGFAHGVAGIGYFLLAAAHATETSRFFYLAREAGETLCRAGQLDTDGAAWWAAGPTDRTRLPHWCSGSSGVGTFLLRLYAVTGEQHFGDLAAAAAKASYRARFQSGPAACHGLAGDGQFLLDAAAVFGDRTYQQWAEDLVPLLAARSCVRDGLALAADETGRTVVADYNVGLAGVVDFLHRLRHGGPRPFMADELLGLELHTEKTHEGAARC
ncbi:class IV lanthionine synthetase LanL [Tenggerimyces flavus]|uniref:non-specific serine/threonine protein kinase n=1 Tax=Tenggerimyces flavus TaxID=1708749 RepID=A0ABV7YK18_9ACTN|nr:class IV lanthionine synthetase LanL [Tenggerimyces flavus]MBM7787622.1 hypothetical protein [Tenggerimyces flavus]